MDFDRYQSPFSFRYGTDPLRRIWSETNKRLLWRRIWLALAEVQAEYGLVTQEQLEDLRANGENIDIPRARQIEAEIHHDLMAEIKTFAEQCPIGGGIIHLGATSMDIIDNADTLRIRQSLGLLLPQLHELLLLLADKIEAYADLPVIAHTHIQPAEPTTLGYRLSLYAQDLLADWLELDRLHKSLKGKGFKGAVGTSASYADLIGEDNLPDFEVRLSAILGLDFFPVTSQTYPRAQDYRLISALAGLGASLYKFAFDLRILQSPPFGELGEPFGEKQVGSSAMPFKRNPINAEKLNSLGRALAQMPRLAWDNAAHSLLERTLDDSANRRTLLPEAFLTADEMLRVSSKIVAGLQVNEDAIRKNIAIYGPFAATERVLMALVKKGADRQEMHECIRDHTLSAWEAIGKDRPNPLTETISSDSTFLSLLTKEQLIELMNAETYYGDAPQRARAFAAHLRHTLT